MPMSAAEHRAADQAEPARRRGADRGPGRRRRPLPRPHRLRGLPRQVAAAAASAGLPGLGRRGWVASCMRWPSARPRPQSSPIRKDPIAMSAINDTYPAADRWRRCRPLHEGHARCSRCAASRPRWCRCCRMPACKFQSYNILEDADLRNGLKEFSNWPTFPQLYVKGELVGGCDIIREMYESGELDAIAERQGHSQAGRLRLAAAATRPPRSPPVRCSRRQARPRSAGHPASH